MTPGALPVEWEEERLRYAVLQCVYDRAGATCDVTITGPEVGAILGLEFTDLFRIVDFLETRGYLLLLGTGPRVCITPKGIEYMEGLALRRRSIRS